MVANPVLSSADVAEDSWVSKAPLHEARAGLGVVAVNGKIYAIGGTTSSTSNAIDGGFVGTNEEYDPATDTWTYRKPMPTPRAYFAIAAYQNKIYCIGGAVGINVNEIGFFSYNVSGVNEVYDTVTNTWETKTPLPRETMQFQAHVVNGKIYVIAWSHMYAYDPTDDSWTTKTRMPPPYSFSSPVSAVVDNKIIVTGEFQIGYTLRSEQRVLIYDTETDNWSEGTSGPTVVVEGAAEATTGVKAPQRVYVLGLAFTNQVYDPKTDAWATATPMPTNRMYFGVAVVNDVLYAIAGYLSSGEITGVNEQYYPIGYGVPPEITVISPENMTYNDSNVTLTFSTSEPTSKISYSLDGQDNVTITGNTTLNKVPKGAHNLTVYATDQFGNTGASETIYFHIDVPEPFPTAAVAAASVIVVTLGAGLLFYSKKHNREIKHE
jgi:N-acetylneuraminic acid mutarotase